MKLKKGWLKRQIEHAEKDIAGWPEWMRREAGLDRANDDVNLEIGLPEGEDWGNK